MTRTGRPPTADKKRTLPCSAPGCTNTVERWIRDLERHKTNRVFCGEQECPGGSRKPRTGSWVQCVRDGCEETFYKRPSSTQEYHDGACRDLANRKERITFICEWCKRDMHILPSQAKCNANRFHKKCYKAWKRAEAIGNRQLRHDGYVDVFMPDHPNAQKSTGRVMEHMLVMSEHLRRKLLSTEEVHHRNGVRDDNRLGNLELWTKSHPAGQRVEDIVEWATEMLATYAQERLARPYRNRAQQTLALTAKETA